MKFTSAGLVVAASLGLFAAAPAHANGCNGVVSQLEWGCAAWDNNNGPQFKHWRGAAPAAPQVPPPSLAPRQGGLVAAGGGNFVGNNGSAVVSNDGAGMRNGGNLIPQDGGGRPTNGH